MPDEQVVYLYYLSSSAKLVLYFKSKNLPAFLKAMWTVWTVGAKIHPNNHVHILVSPSVSLHLLSSLRSVHRWWTHLHGAARRRWSCTKMHVQRIASMDKKKQSSVKRYGFDISWHEMPISRTLPIEPCPTGPPAGIICLKMWARKTSMSSPSTKRENKRSHPYLFVTLSIGR